MRFVSAAGINSLLSHTIPRSALPVEVPEILWVVTRAMKVILAP